MMRTRFFAVPATTAAIVCAAVFAVPAAASTAAAHADGTDGWGKALEVPGIAALDTGDQAVGNAISCPSAGDCLAGGSYLAKGLILPYVVSETHGTWGHARKVATSVSSSYESVDAVSCTSAGNCGIAVNTTNFPMVASELNGTWHKPVQIPGVGQASGSVTALSCNGRGDCTAGGLYSGVLGSPLFAASEVNGVWHKAIVAPGAGR
jgi:hypothetical protein